MRSHFVNAIERATKEAILRAFQIGSPGPLRFGAPTPLAFASIRYTQLASKFAIVGWWLRLHLGLNDEPS